MDRQLSWTTPAVSVGLTRAELELLVEGLRQLVEQTAASRDECVAMGLGEMASGADLRLRDLERLLARLDDAAGCLDPAETP